MTDWDLEQLKRVGRWILVPTLLGYVWTLEPIGIIGLATLLKLCTRNPGVPLGAEFNPHRSPSVRSVERAKERPKAPVEEHHQGKDIPFGDD